VITLDASGSFSPAGNTPLTFNWTTVNIPGNGNGVTIANGNTPNPTLTLPGVGYYPINLTVTDSKGNATSTVVNVRMTTRDNL